MKLKTSLLLVSALATALQSGLAADITGKITLKGTPPPEKELPLDPGCGKLHPDKKPTTRFYVAAADGGLADVYVYIKEGLSGSAPAPSGSTLLDQKGCEYK